MKPKAAEKCHKTDNPEPSGITLEAIFSKAATTVDGGWNVTLSVDPRFARELMQLAELRDTLLQCAFIPVRAFHSPSNDLMEL